MQAVPAIFSLVVAAAGWFYLFYSRGAHELAGIENPFLNLVRIRLRRVGAIVMILLAIAFAVGYYGTDENHPGYTIAWLLVLLLLPALLIVGLLDLWLTQKFRRARLDRARMTTTRAEEKLP